MRFTSLHMRPFGTFDDFELTFGDTSGLHLVYGTNGAGKSTTLEALRSSLYGIQSRKKVHAASDLRIGAALERADGQAIEFLRRTSPKKPLWNKADDEALPVEALAPFLGNLERSRFETLFGLDYETMVAGGAELLEGKGEIGRALFGAMLGGKRLREVTTRLEADLKSQYVNNSPKGRINELVKAHKSLTSDLKKAMVRPASHQDDRRKLKALHAAHAFDVEERDTARSHVQSLTALRRSITSLDQLDAKREERAALGGLTPIDKAKAQRVLELSKEADALAARADERAKELHTLRETTAHTEAAARPKLLAHSSTIEALARRRGAFEDAAAASADLQRQLEEANVQRTEALRQAGSDAESLVVPSDATGAARGAAAGSSLDELSQAAERFATRMTKAESARTIAHESVCLAEPVTAAATVRAEQLEDRLHGELANELLTLEPFRGRIDELRSLDLPTEEELNERAREEQAVIAERQRLDERRERTQAEVQAATQALRKIAADNEGPPPTLAEVQAARDARDARISRAFSGGSATAQDALEIQRTVHHADHLLDRRGRESTLAAERDVQEAARSRAEVQLAETVEALAGAERQASTQDDAWTERLSSCHPSLATMDAAALQGWASRRLAVLREAQAFRDATRRDLERAQAAEAEQRARLKAAEVELEATRADWSQWARARSLDPAAGPEAAQRRLRMLVGVHAADREIARLEREIAERTGSAVAFTEEVAQCCEQMEVRPNDSALETALESAGEDGVPESAVLTLVRIDALTEALRAAQTTAAKLEELNKRLLAETAAGEASTAHMAEIDKALGKLTEAAGCASLGELLRVAKLSDQARSLDADIRQLEASLTVQHGEDMDPAELRASIGARTLDDLAHEIEVAEEAVRALDEFIAERAREEGVLDHRVHATGSADASRMQSEIAGVEAELAEATAEFLKVHLADQLLRREIERNRRETHGPLLERAQELFKTLTLGAYEQLHPSELSSGKEVMVARRPNGRQVGVEEMSSGTCDQLYLALRIASVEHMLQTIEPMPFIADDLFVNFDDQRTEAALRVLAELAKSTQVIVFSHHNSVVETALRLTDEGVPVDVLRLNDERSREAARE